MRPLTSYFLRLVIVGLSAIVAAGYSIRSDSNFVRFLAGAFTIALVWSFLKRIYVLRSIAALYKSTGVCRGTILLPRSRSRADYARHSIHETVHLLKDYGFIKDDTIASAAAMLRMAELGFHNHEAHMKRSSDYRIGYETMKRVLNGNLPPEELDRVQDMDETASQAERKTQIYGEWFGDER